MSRIEELTQQFGLQMEVAREVGIFDEIFLCFGSLLGYCRDGGFIAGDDDMDIGYRSEHVSMEQERNFIRRLREAGLGEYRWITQFNPVTGRLFWFSLCMHTHGHGYKCCNWAWFCHKGHYYHHKGTDGGRQSLIKGTPKHLIVPGDTVSYLGVKVRIPVQPGTLLDCWYPDWGIPAGGNSAAAVLLNTGGDQGWANPQQWSISINT